MIKIDGEKTAFLAGDTIDGTITWDGDPPARSAELRLFWYTSGRGTNDVGIVQSRKLEPTSSSNPIRFTFTLPAGPYTFAGKLIILDWAIELVTQPGSRTQRVEFCMSPDGKPITLIATDPISPGL